MSILDKNNDDKPAYEYATQNSRIVSILVDFLAIFILNALLMYIIQSGSDYVAPDIEAIEVTNVFGFALMFLYYFVQEYFFEGKTIGKYFTNTRTVFADGSKITLGAIFFKTVIRCFLWPVLFLIFLFYREKMLYDGWTGTVVVKD